jgi:D-ribose pyranose/furanose isomerase RbsD
MKITPSTIHETMTGVVVSYRLNDEPLVADGDGFVEIPDNATHIDINFTRNAYQTQQVVIELGGAA